MTVLTEWPWKVGYRRGTLLSPHGREFKAWCHVEREEDVRAPYPGAEPKPVSYDLVFHVAVTYDDGSGLAYSTASLEQGLPWRLHLGGRYVTLRITNTEIDVDATIEFTGRLIPEDAHGGDR